MSDTAELLTFAEQHGIDLFIENGQLILEGNQGALAPEFVEQAKQHKPELLLTAITRQACKGLDITPLQFQSILSDEDIKLIQQGRFTNECLSAYAQSFAEGIQSGRIVFHPNKTQAPYLPNR